MSARSAAAAGPIVVARCCQCRHNDDSSRRGTALASVKTDPSAGDRPVNACCRGAGGTTQCGPSPFRRPHQKTSLREQRPLLQRSGVHPTALVADGADLGEGVVLGPGCIVGPRVRLGDGCRLRAYVVVEGDTVLGPGCDVYPFAVIGGRPQDKKLRLNGEGRAKDAAWTDED